MVRKGASCENLMIGGARWWMAGLVGSSQEEGGREHWSTHVAILVDCGMSSINPNGSACQSSRGKDV